MKKILFIMAVMLTISACDVIEQRSLGDDLLTVFDNKTKATKSIAYRGNKLLTDCRDFRLADYTHRTTTFIAVTDNGESLYRFSNEGGKETLTKYYSAKHIDLMIAPIQWLPVSYINKTGFMVWKQPMALHTSSLSMKRFMS